MGMGNTLANGVLGLIFQAGSIANLAINATSSPLTNLENSLHTANPGAGGSQTTSESAYTNYARVPVARTSGGWGLSGQTITPVANITFPTGAGAPDTVTYWGIGSAHTGTGVLYFSGPVSPSVLTGNGITPQITTASTIVLS